MSDPTAGVPGSDEKVLQISKYPNRRYYDRTRGRHLTLEELHAAIRDGHEIRVTDSKTGDDITVKVLAQIILELDPPKLGVFPVRLLHRLLRTNEELIGDFTRKYVSQAFEAFLDSQKKAELFVRQAMGLHPGNAAASAGGEWAKMMWGAFNPAMWAGPTAGGDPSRAASAGDPARAATDPAAGEFDAAAAAREIDALRREVQSLRSRLQPAARKSAKRAKAPAQPSRPPRRGKP